MSSNWVEAYRWFPDLLLSLWPTCAVSVAPSIGANWRLPWHWGSATYLISRQVGRLKLKRQVFMEPQVLLFPQSLIFRTQSLIVSAHVWVKGWQSSDHRLEKMMQYWTDTGDSLGYLGGINRRGQSGELICVWVFMEEWWTHS